MQETSRVRDLAHARMTSVPSPISPDNYAGARTKLKCWVSGMSQVSQPCVPDDVTCTVCCTDVKPGALMVK